MGIKADEVLMSRRWGDITGGRPTLTHGMHPHESEFDNAFGLNPHNSYGIEVEIENVFPSMPDEVFTEYNTHLNKLYDDGWWRIDEDGSLRNNGREFISYPLPGNQVSHAFNRLYAVVHKQADFNLRAGIHVHVNCRNMSVGEINKAILLSIVFESMMFKMTDPSRHNNIFCVPVSASDGAYDMLMWFANKGPAIQKYSALNVLPLLDRSFGTVEFRHLESTNDMKKLEKWFKTIDCIWTYAKNEVKFEELLIRVSALTTSSMFFALGEDVFGMFWSQLRELVTHGEMNRNVAKIKQLLFTEDNAFCGDDMQEWLANNSKFMAESVLSSVANLRRTALDTAVESPED
jgi:hypothetical protein